VGEKPLVSIVTPMLNESETVAHYFARLNPILARLSDRYDFEIIITDNRSTDNTFQLLQEVAARDPRVRAYRFSRNFGYQLSIWTGYSQARGVVAIELDADLQDPPEMIDVFLKHWEEGAKIVCGVREKRAENPILEASRKAFYRLINAISPQELPPDAGDFMLLDRRVLDLLKTTYDPAIYIRGLVHSFGFKRVSVPYQRHARVAGNTKFPFWRLVALAMDGIVRSSTLPLRLASIAGIALFATSSLLILGYFVGRLFFPIDWPAGFTTLIVVQLLTLAMLAMFLGIIGEYIARIYGILKRGPMTIIDEMTEGALSGPSARPPLPPAADVDSDVAANVADLQARRA